MPVAWWRVIYVSACCLTLAIDTDRLPNLPSWFWSAMYLACVAALLLWRITGWRCLLTTFGALMFSASSVRGVTLVFDERYAGAALNFLLAYWVVQAVIYRHEPAT